VTLVATYGVTFPHMVRRPPGRTGDRVDALGRRLLPVDRPARLPEGAAPTRPRRTDFSHRRRRLHTGSHPPQLGVVRPDREPVNDVPGPYRPRPSDRPAGTSRRLRFRRPPARRLPSGILPGHQVPGVPLTGVPARRLPRLAKAALAGGWPGRGRCGHDELLPRHCDRCPDDQVSGSGSERPGVGHTRR
jgi:hypothetical protein